MLRLLTGYTGSGGDIIIPATIDGHNVTRIGSYAFLECQSLISVAVPNSMTSIDVSVFLSCTSLIRVTISDSVTSIGDYSNQRL